MIFVRKTQVTYQKTQTVADRDGKLQTKVIMVHTKEPAGPKHPNKNVFARVEPIPTPFSGSREFPLCYICHEHILPNQWHERCDRMVAQARAYARRKAGV